MSVRSISISLRECQLPFDHCVKLMKGALPDKILLSYIYHDLINKHARKSNIPSGRSTWLKCREKTDRKEVESLEQPWNEVGWLGCSGSEILSVTLASIGNDAICSHKQAKSILPNVGRNKMSFYPFYFTNIYVSQDFKTIITTWFNKVICRYYIKFVKESPLWIWLPFLRRKVDLFWKIAHF